jgi:hypothetical protein
LVCSAGLILANPRYTGHRVSNRLRTEEDLADPGDVSLGHRGRTWIRTSGRRSGVGPGS